MATDQLRVMDAPHVRLDAALVARGHARSRAQAHELIEANRVLVGGVPARKPSQRVTSQMPVVVLGERDPWVGRAAYKLLG
ncbi:MAG TPA: S4 domain-containing protein, partial [Dermatophilaceae bacterium]|nr:S4 domain-containing protein [Dermatophilaceae bacterium]